MDKIIIEGGHPLSGVLPISGSKNGVLPLMVAALLTAEKLHLQNAPALADTVMLGNILTKLGAQVTQTDKAELTVHAENIHSTTAPYELVSKMRAGFWVLGPLLARCGQAHISLPGGCAIGTRPVDFYLRGLASMGAEIDVSGGYVHAHIARPNKGNRLQGARLDLPFVSVGATHVLMMAASLAKGETCINNAASEPEIVDMGRCLQAMGAKIEGLGTRHIIIEGVESLSGTKYHIMHDRIEMGAYACAAIATRSTLTLANADIELMGALVPALRQSGASLTQTKQGLHVSGENLRPKPTHIVTAPWPGFATDLQAPFMALMCLADGTSHIRETIFENRFMHVQELTRLGAQISLKGDTAIVQGVEQLLGAPVMATDLRASVALIIAGLVAKGQTVVNRIYHLDRGFERLEEKLSACGAKIWRET